MWKYSCVEKCRICNYYHITQSITYVLLHAMYVLTTQKKKEVQSLPNYEYHNKSLGS